MPAGGPAPRIEPQRLSEEAWAPFGWLPVPDTDPRDGAGGRRLEFAWNDGHLNLIGHDRAEVPASADGSGLRCQMLFRHLTHTQALMVLDHPAVLAVAAPGTDFRTGAAPGASPVQAFALQPFEPLVLWRGTWHWGPFPVGAPRVTMLNLQGLRYAEDNDMVDLGTLGREVEVGLGTPPPG